MLSYNRPTRSLQASRGSVILRPSLEHQTRQIDAQIAAETAYARRIMREIPGITWTEALVTSARVVAQDPQFRGGA